MSSRTSSSCPLEWRIAACAARGGLASDAWQSKRTYAQPHTPPDIAVRAYRCAHAICSHARASNRHHRVCTYHRRVLPVRLFLGRMMEASQENRLARQAHRTRTERSCPFPCVRQLAATGRSTRIFCLRCRDTSRPAFACSSPIRKRFLFARHLVRCSCRIVPLLADYLRTFSLRRTRDTVVPSRRDAPSL